MFDISTEISFKDIDVINNAVMETLSSTSTQEKSRTVPDPFTLFQEAIKYEYPEKLTSHPRVHVYDELMNKNPNKAYLLRAVERSSLKYSHSKNTFLAFIPRPFTYLCKFYCPFLDIEIASIDLAVRNQNGEYIPFLDLSRSIKSQTVDLPSIPNFMFDPYIRIGVLIRLKPQSLPGITLVDWSNHDISLMIDGYFTVYHDTLLLLENTKQSHRLDIGSFVRDPNNMDTYTLHGKPFRPEIKIIGRDAFSGNVYFYFVIS